MTTLLPRRAKPRSTLIIRPLHSHAEKRMHVELHYSISPWVDIYVRIVAVRDWGHGVVHVFAGILSQAHHIDQSTALDDGSGARRPIPVTGHVQIIGGGHSDGRLECCHTDPIVGPNGTDRRLPTLLPCDAISRSCVGEVIPCGFRNATLTGIGEMERCVAIFFVFRGEATIQPPIMTTNTRQVECRRTATPERSNS